MSGQTGSRAIFSELVCRRERGLTPVRLNPVPFHAMTQREKSQFRRRGERRKSQRPGRDGPRLRLLVMELSDGRERQERHRQRAFVIA